MKKNLILGLFLSFIVLGSLNFISAEQQTCWAYAPDGSGTNLGLKYQDFGQNVDPSNISEQACKNLYFNTEAKVKTQICANYHGEGTIKFLWITGELPTIISPSSPNTKEIYSFNLNCASTCTDTEEGIDHYVAGKVTETSEYHTTTVEDLCFTDDDGNSAIRDFFCENNRINHDGSTVCPNGCFNGACVEKSSEGICTDSDGGINYYKKGKAYGNNYCDGGCGPNGEEDEIRTQYWQDYCLDESHVYDFTCSSNGLDAISNLYNCPNGCYDGACIEEKTEESTSKDHFRYSKWKCYSGETEYNEDPTSCKSESTWKQYAREFCNEECSDEGKCGVEHFAVASPCGENSKIGTDTRTINEKLDGLEQIVGQLLSTLEPTELTDKIGNLADRLGDAELKEGNLKSGLKDLKELLHDLKGKEEFDRNEELVYEKALHYIEDIKNMLEKGHDYEEREGYDAEYEGDTLICKNSCVFEDSCLPIGTRAEGKFCDIRGELIPQLESSAQCENNFECGSNLCVNNQCISGNLIQKILNWFSRLFSSG